VEILNAIAAGTIKRVRWVSFGSNPDSWFFAYELKNGQASWRCGPHIPAALERILEHRRITPSTTPGLRVQLGNASSFVFWFWPMWVCYDVPSSLRKELEIKSASYQRQGVIETGYFSGNLANIPDIITWHRDGSYYVHSCGDHVWNFRPTMNAHWKMLWEQSPGNDVEMVAMAFHEIAVRTLGCLQSKTNMSQYVAINPHPPTSEKFAFIKTQRDEEAAPFIVHFGTNDMHTRLPRATSTDASTQQLIQETEPVTPPRWAVSKRTGRPNPKDSWELELKKGERVQIMRDCGRDWYIVKDSKSIRGYAHRSWLDFRLTKASADPKPDYAQFEENMRQLLVPGQLRNFPPVLDYLGVCSEDVCLVDKEDAIPRLCIHNLETLLETSGEYSYEWLKEERNVWHPDKFARFCHPNFQKDLKTEAQELFVMYGVLMDKCRVEEGGSASG
jgi:methylenetetrahydrofolate dehydrogenase (NADP+)/methenyltetrahydrofolate cyclohydrolase/formyltetrahydrofolate synthetase